VPRSFVRSTKRVIALLRAKQPGTLSLTTDDHPAYRAAVRHGCRDGPIVHRVFPNPSRAPGSDLALAGARDRAMFATDLLHKLLRHSQAHHRRETIAFGRRSNALIERAAVMAVWRNFVKHVTERRLDPRTPARILGLTDRVWTWRDVLSERRFPGRLRLPPGWTHVYRRRWITPAVGRNQRHDLRHAY
jgi:hypothetical protein